MNPVATAARHRFNAPSAEVERQNDHRFFDPKSPDQPSQIFGVDTKAILELGSAAAMLGVFSPRVNLGLLALPNAVRLMPLIETMQDRPLTAEDVRPYRKPIKDSISHLDMRVKPADKLAVAAGAIAIGVPLRRAINRKIEREFSPRTVEAVNKAREIVASIETDVDYFATFDNPKQQFIGELDFLAETVSTAIITERDSRVRNDLPAAPVEIPEGKVGTLIKVARKVRSLLNIFNRRPVVNPEITAYDAGAGIEKAVVSLLQNPLDSFKRLPMLSKFLISRLPNGLPMEKMSKDKLALLAPELLNFIFSGSTQSETKQHILASVKRNPHELRFVTRFIKRYGRDGRYDLDSIRYASKRLMPAVRNVLPAEGVQIRAIFDQVQHLLGSITETNQVQQEANETKSSQKRRRGIFSKLRR
jgi:hypothetical protein